MSRSLSPVMQRIAALRGFARADECDGVRDAGDFPVLDERDEVVGWIENVGEDSERLFEIGESSTSREERERLLETLVVAERDLLCACIAAGETSILREALEQSSDDGDADDSDEADGLPSLANLDRRECAAASRYLVVALSPQLAKLPASLREAITHLSEVRERLFRTNFTLAVSLAKSHGRGCDWTLALLAACDGLNEALDRFEPERGHQFSTYATWWLRQAINRARQNHSTVLRMPVYAQELYGKYVKEERNLWEESEFRPSPDEVGEAGNFGTSTLVNIVEWRRSSLYALLGTQLHPAGSAEALFDPDLPCPIDGGLSDASTSRLEAHVLDLCWRASHLRPQLDVKDFARERQMLYGRLGLGEERKTLLKIGTQHNVSRERVRQLQDRMLARAVKFLNQSGDFSLQDPWYWEPEDE